MPLPHAIRTFRSWRMGAAVAIATLAVGIGTATSMYALVRMALNGTIPDIEDRPALGRIFASSRTLGIERSQLTLSDLDLVAAASSFESVGAYVSDEAEMATGDERVRISLGRVSAGFFAAIRTRAAGGRLLSADDFRERAEVAVVSDRVWRNHFAGQVLGRAVLTVEGRPRTVVGVLPPDFGFPLIGIAADAWVPLSLDADTAKLRVGLLARLKRGVTWTAAGAELDALGRSRNPNGLWTWTAVTVEQDVRTRTTGGFAMMFGPALVVLLIGCTNVACMLLARGIDRDVELSVRAALGATRARIVRQLLGEHVVLALAGGICGTGLAWALVHMIAAAFAQFRPDAPTLVPSNAALAATGFCFSLGACVLFGMVPAVRLSRRDLITSLKGGTAPAVARFVGYRGRDLVVFVELGLAAGLVVTMAMFTRFLGEIERMRPRFPAAEVVMLRLPSREAPGAAERVAGLPGVAGVTTVSDLPGGERASHAARGQADNGRGGKVAVIGVQPSFFQTLGLPMLRGRSFHKAEDSRSPVAIVSETAAAALWPGGDALGARLRITSGATTSTADVVGVSRDALEAGAMVRSGLIAPDVYVPLDTESASEVVLLVRARNAHALVKAIAVAARPSPSAPIPHPSELSATFVHEDSRFVIGVFAGFSLIALLLAGSGIFGVVTQSVAQRKTEFGVRMAMGASSGQVLRMVLAREAKLIGAAAASGIAVTVLITRVAFVEMLVLTGEDPRLWLTVAGLCGGVAALAVGFATSRIVKVDPWQVLRQL